METLPEDLLVAIAGLSPGAGPIVRGVCPLWKTIFAAVFEKVSLSTAIRAGVFTPLILEWYLPVWGLHIDAYFLCAAFLERADLVAALEPQVAMGQLTSAVRKGSGANLLHNLWAFQVDTLGLQATAVIEYDKTKVAAWKLLLYHLRDKGSHPDVV
jgi:hypothetical protein